MSFIDKVKDSITTRAAEVIAASFTVLLAWVASQVAPAIESAISKQVLLALLATSLVLNVIFFFIVWLNAKKELLRLKYGIYWDKDKNPHCPSCKTPVATYGYYSTDGYGYYCKPCNKVFPLADASGNNLEPTQVLAEL